MKTQFITDEKGRKVSVIIPVKEYYKIIEDLEELEDIKAYDEAMESNEEIISFDRAVEDIESANNDLRD